MDLSRDFKSAWRSLWLAKGLSVTVILTLALGIGANAAIFSLIRGVLLRPLVNADEDRLIYIRQSAPGIPAENTTFSVPGDSGPAGRRPDARQSGRVLDHRLHDDRARRAPDGSRRRRRRTLLRGDGAAPGPWPSAHDRRRRAGRRWGRGSHLPVLDHPVQQRSGRHRQDHPARLALGHHRRRARTVGAVSGRNGADRERRHQPASFVGDDGHRARAPDDRDFRPAWRRARTSRPPRPSSV